MNPRLFEDDLDDPQGERPYREGDVYICRNCAAELPNRAAYCGRCYQRRQRELRRQREESHE